MLSFSFCFSLNREKYQRITTHTTRWDLVETDQIRTQCYYVHKTFSCKWFWAPNKWVLWEQVNRCTLLVVLFQNAISFICRQLNADKSDSSLYLNSMDSKMLPVIFRIFFFWYCVSTSKKIYESIKDIQKNFRSFFSIGQISKTQSNHYKSVDTFWPLLMCHIVKFMLS